MLIKCKQAVHRRSHLVQNLVTSHHHTFTYLSAVIKKALLTVDFKVQNSILNLISEIAQTWCVLCSINRYDIEIDII